MPNSNDLIRKLRLEIKAHLTRCDSNATPWICAEIQTLEGYKRIETLAIGIISKDGVSIGAALANIEAELT